MLASIIRTVVPIVAGYFLGWPVVRALDLTAEQVTALVTAVVTGLYYIGARALEQYASPQFGWLLGMAKRPSYPVATGTSTPEITPAPAAGDRLFDDKRILPGDGGAVDVSLIGTLMLVWCSVGILLLLLGKSFS